MILADDNYATIVAAVHQGRVIFDNIKKFLRYLLSSNMGEVVTVFFGVVFAGFLGLSAATGSGELVVPLLATQILWINLVTDSAPALAMGVDPEIDDVMARPPRRPEDRIMDRAMWVADHVHRPRDGRGDPAHDRHVPARRRHRGLRLPRGRPHGRLHDPGVRAAVQRAELALRDHQRVPRAVQQQVAVGRPGARGPSCRCSSSRSRSSRRPSAPPRSTSASGRRRSGMASIVLWAEELAKWIRRRVQPRPSGRRVAAGAPSP